MRKEKVQRQLPPFKVEQEIYVRFEDLRRNEISENGGIPSRVEMFRRMVKAYKKPEAQR